MSENQTAPPAAGQRPRSPVRRAIVDSVERVTPLLRRIMLTGEELAGFGPPRPASHIKLHMAPLGTAWSPTDETAPRPPRRTYTPRSFDPVRLRLEVEFVLHGHGLAARWAEQATPGQEIFVSGPGGGYDVPVDATSIVLVADDTALPAAGMILESLPAGCDVTMVAEIAGRDEQRPLSARVPCSAMWLHRDETNARGGTLLEQAVHALASRADDALWWIACEASAMRRIRQHLIQVRGVAPARLHTRGYWKLGETAYPDHDYGKE